ncbi:hypothetical protein Dda3937_00551 [Dickeya dadantii 3937]|uniref:Uncharacterized protein n=1 Tax=Dickeya dadantii (strain 3937) TaxID=198628 RepID=E0SJP9_DICD3|nr:hypothetical protein Dda3937_00551 [Dickeya dadantii 3937]
MNSPNVISPDFDNTINTRPHLIIYFYYKEMVHDHSVMHHYRLAQYAGQRALACFFQQIQRLAPERRINAGRFGFGNTVSAINILCLGWKFHGYFSLSVFALRFGGIPRLMPPTGGKAKKWYGSQADINRHASCAACRW